jgi:uncharacterized protein
MLIHEMSEKDCRKALKEATLGRLACVRENRPYVVPIYFAFDGEHIYSFTTLGKKVRWMRSNPHVCLEIDEQTSHNNWMSIVVFGRYEELPDEPQYKPARMAAHHLLQRRTMWWEPAYVATEHRQTPDSFTPIFYRIQIESMTGHRATLDQAETSGVAVAVAPVNSRRSWWNNLLRHLWSGASHVSRSSRHSSIVHQAYARFLRNILRDGPLNSIPNPAAIDSRHPILGIP